MRSDFSLNIRNRKKNIIPTDDGTDDGCGCLEVWMHQDFPCYELFSLQRTHPRYEIFGIRYVFSTL